MNFWKNAKLKVLHKNLQCLKEHFIYFSSKNLKNLH